jgi:hypothetical protein
VTTDLGQSGARNGAGQRAAHQDISRSVGPPSPAASRLLGPGRRRRPAVWALGLALVMGGGAVAAATTMAAGDRVAVLAVVRPVDAGTAIEAADLGEARVAADPRLEPIPVGDRDRVVGQVADVDLRPGTLLTRSELDQIAIPGLGQALVGVDLAPGRLPARALRRGDHVLVVVTAEGASAGQSVPGAAEPRSLSAQVVATGRVASDGSVVVDLLVGQGDAAGLAADAAAGRVSVVLLPRAG